MGMRYIYVCDGCKKEIEVPDYMIPGGWRELEIRGLGGGEIQYVGIDDISESQVLLFCPECIKSIKANLI